MCFSVVSHLAEPRVSIFIAKMKKWLRKDAKLIVFFDFSNHARARVPIFTPEMKNSRLARLARLARPAPRKWDFRRRSRPRELAQRSQDDVSLNKLPQISRKKTPSPIWGHFRSIFPWTNKNPKIVEFVPIFLGGPMGPTHPVWFVRRQCWQRLWK